MKTIAIANGAKIIVDDEDYPYLNRFKWRDTGTIVVTQFWSSEQHPTFLPVWAFLLPRPNKYEIVIHKNKDRFDFRKSNIEIIKKTTWQHGMPKRKNTSSKYRGVCWIKERQKWECYISKNGKTIRIGKFKNEKEAALAYNEKARELYGDNAFQNIVEGSDE